MWGQCASTTRKPRRTSVKSTSMMICPGEPDAAPPHHCAWWAGLGLGRTSEPSSPFLCGQAECWAAPPTDNPCVLQDPVSRVQPQRGVFRLLGCSFEPHCPRGRVGTRHRRQGHQPGAGQAAALGHEDHEAAGGSFPWCPRAGHPPGRGALRLHRPLFLWSLPSFLWAPHILICEISERVEK